MWGLMSHMLNINFLFSMEKQHVVGNAMFVKKSLTYDLHLRTLFWCPRRLIEQAWPIPEIQPASCYRGM